MRTTRTAAQRYNDRMTAIFDTAAEQTKQDKALPLEYAGGSIGNTRRGPVAMLVRGAWGYDDETGRIMAAAPELLDVLKEMLRWDTRHTNYRAAACRAARIIAKATNKPANER